MSALPAVAVVGIGSIGCGDFRDESLATMTNRAVSGALADSGLERREIDGLFVHIGSPRGLDYDELALLLGLEIQLASQTWSHGRFGATVIGTAAMALQCGVIDVALCVGAFKSSPFGRPGSTTFVGFREGMREGGGPHAETPSVGMAAPAAGAAMSTRRYLDRYGIDREQLGAVAIAQRASARSNPDAVLREPMSRADYEASRYVIEPLRLFDCSIPTDCAVAVLLTRGDRARALSQPPVWVLGFQGIHAGPNEFIFGQPGLGINQVDVFDFAPNGGRQPVFGRSGVQPADVGTLHCYDGFSTQVLWTLERFGFCTPGEGADFVQNGRIELGGSLPVNTAGGHLSEGHANGWGHTVELVRQLRGHAGDRQIEGLQIGLWATTLGDSIVYANEIPYVQIRDFPGIGELGPLLPPLTEQSAPYFDALQEGKLELQRCSTCSRARAHIAPVCPYCGGETSSWQTASGTGAVHSWVRYRRSYLPEFEPLLPYVVLCVTLAEGPRIFGRLVDADGGRAADPFPAMPVETVFERWSDGGITYAFTTAEAMA